MYRLDTAGFNHVHHLKTPFSEVV